ncbi:MAG: Rab family GTPase [Candidatus Kariarchaeaceae archaeon]
MQKRFLPDATFKIILVGDGQVGKTSIRRQYMGRSFRVNYMPTLGCDWASRTATYQDKKLVLTIWDLAGQNMFKGMRSTFYYGTSFLISVFDVTNPDSLTSVRSWISEAFEYCSDTILGITIIGNKIDLSELKSISDDDVRSLVDELKKEYKIPIFLKYTSALTGENIDQVFHDISESLMSQLFKEDLSLVQQATIDSSTPPPQSTSSEDENSILSRVSQLETNIDRIEEITAKLESHMHLLDIEVSGLKRIVMTEEVLDMFKSNKSKKEDE